MNIREFIIGDYFYYNNGKYKCTDIGTRTISAIKILGDENTSIYQGPPYKVTEILFNLDEIKLCKLEEEKINYIDVDYLNIHNCFCIECGKPAEYILFTQFAGNHPYCEEHAKQNNEYNLMNRIKYGRYEYDKYNTCYEIIKNIENEYELEISKKINSFIRENSKFKNIILGVLKKHVQKNFENIRG